MELTFKVKLLKDLYLGEYKKKNDIIEVNLDLMRSLIWRGVAVQVTEVVKEKKRK